MGVLQRLAVTATRRCQRRGRQLSPAVTEAVRLMSTKHIVSHKPEPWEEIYTQAPIDFSEPTFGKILIANRGEIACRIIRTARKMGIKTVAVHSVADANSLFVKMADESVNIGPPAARESYLVVDKILRAVKDTGAEAVHPGYGFLSENTGFVAELEKAGVTFIGPNSTAIREMGDKIASKKLANEAKVNCIPGFDGVVEDAEHCVTLANEIGYPVMIKASAGGGGKGMRVANSDTEVREAFHLCSEEGAASFGDDRMLIEKFVDQPRHVEIQVLGDKHGNAIHLNERECSIQRRNQKVIEEAPSPFLDPETRAAMGDQAVQLSKAIGYDSAGTVEFLVDGQKNFYFLEMNTRLQVEHPITECITGVDLVHQMIRAAYGHPLMLTQDDIGINGWAIENRVYAEDPFKNFGLPSIGRLYKYQEPTGSGVRCDSGIQEGSEISMYYDPMICKLTTYGKDREEARERAIHALDHYVIRGTSHNVALLRDVLTEPKFIEGDFTTNYLPETYPEGFKGVDMTPAEKAHLAAVVGVMHCKRELRSRELVNDPTVFNQQSEIKNMALTIVIRDEDIEVELERRKKQGDMVCRVTYGGETTVLTIADDFNLSDLVYHPTIKDSDLSPAIQLITRFPDGSLRTRYRGTPMNIKVFTQKTAGFRQFMKEKPQLDLTKVVLSPMPGVVKGVCVEVGQMVGEGHECCIVEAMKMQNSMKATVTSKVKAIHVSVGEPVEEDQVLVEFE